jgi:hypothetical protein
MKGDNAMKSRTCNHCAFGTASDVGATTITCVNTIEAPGQLRRVDPAGTCRRFRPKPRPALRLDPPPPPNDQIRYIALTRARFAIVDAADYEWLSRYKWYAGSGSSGAAYACRTTRQRRLITMHRQIMEPPDGFVVDHIDGNKFNNCRGNLRICTQAQNVCNARGQNASSKYKGVRHLRGRRKWDVQIGFQGRRQHIGSFDDEIEAALAYDLKAVALFGPFAYLNFPHITKATRQAAKLKEPQHVTPDASPVTSTRA